MTLRIDSFGGFTVTVDGRAVVPKAWSQRKPAALVKLLALAPGRQLRREQAMDAPWPELDPQAAAENLRKALHSARRSLGPGEGAELILSAGASAALADGDLTAARQRLHSAAWLYKSAGHSFWADRASAQQNAVSAAN